MASKSWRLSNLYKIIDDEGNLITFKPNIAQQYLIDNLWSRNIILKARQLGFTTYSVIDMLDDVLFKSNFECALIAHERESMVKIFRKVQLAWDEFPKYLKEEFGWVADTESKNELRFNNGSSISVTLSARSGTLNRLHISEFGKICAWYPEKAREIITGSIPAVMQSGRIDIESTAEGNYGPFYDMYWEAAKHGVQKSSKEFRAFFFPWTQDDKYEEDPKNLREPLTEEMKEYQALHHLTDRQIAWYNLTKASLEKAGEGMMMQEYPTTAEEAFLAGNNTFFDQDNITTRLSRDIKPGKQIGRDIIQYEEWIPSHRYGIGADVSEGIGRDSCTAVVIDFSSVTAGGVLIPRVVARYESNNIDPISFAYELRNLGMMYGYAIIAPERNNHGHATIGKLKEIYPNIYKEQLTDRYTDVESVKLGFHTTKSSKPEILMALKNALRNDEIIIPDRGILLELKHYGRLDFERTTFDEDVSKHFDLVMALSIAYHMRNFATSGVIEYSSDNESQEAFDPHKMIQF